MSEPKTTPGPTRAERRRDTGVLSARGSASRERLLRGEPEPDPVGLRDLGPTVLPRAVFLIAVMALGSVLMWLGAPAAWLWIASQIGEVGNPTIGPLLLIAAGLPVTMVLIAIWLRRLDRRFSELTGMNRENRRVQLPWMRSMRGERDSGRRATILDVVMIASVSVAGVLFVIWFFGFAHPGLPQ
jgi:hypothetical protein